MLSVVMPNHFPLEGSGSGIYAQNVARELTAQGHTACTICPDHQPATGYDFETRTILFTPDGEAAGERLPFNFPCFTTHPKSVTTYYELDAGQIEAYRQAFLDQLHAAIEATRPDVLHANHLWVAAWACRQTGLPYVATTHGTDLMGFREDSRYHEMALEGAQGAARVICISREVRSEATELYGLTDAQQVLLPNGYDTSRFRPYPELARAEVFAGVGLEEDPPYHVAFVGKLTRFKGIDVLLDAAAIYERALPGVVTTIAGDGELRGALTEQIARLGLQGVRLLGHQNQDDVARLFSSADVAVVPSRHEPFGLVALEAMGCGTSVVATAAGGLPDFVTDRVGELVPLEQSEPMAAAIVEAVREGHKQTKGVEAARYAAEGYSWTGYVHKLAKVYQEAIAAS